MNAEIQKRLDAESSSSSRGYFTPAPVQHLVLLEANAPTLRLSDPLAGAVEPLAPVDQLLEQARSSTR